MFTSKIPTLDGHYTPLNPKLKTIIKILQDNRVNTCAFHSNPHLGQICNYDRGFNYFFDYFTKPPIYYFDLKIRIKKKISHLFNILNKIFLGKLSNKSPIVRSLKFRKGISFQADKINVSYTNARIIIQEAIRWLKNNYNTNFFLWIHFMDAHRPYNPPNEYISKFSKVFIPVKEKVRLKKLVNIVRENPRFVDNIDMKTKKNTEILYNAELNYIDHYFGIFLKYLKKINILDQTNFIITSDHGESIFEHNKLGHQASLYDELLRIPLIIKLEKNYTQYKKKIEEQVELLDIAPSILDIFKLPKQESFEGLSLIPFIKGDNNYQHPEYIVCATLHNKFRTLTIYEKHLFSFYLLIAIRSSNWKVIYDEQYRRYYFFNLKKDPLELRNLIEVEDEEVSYYRNIYVTKIDSYIKSYFSEESKIKNIIEKNLFKLKKFS